MGMDKPNHIYPSVPTTTHQFMPPQIPDQSLRGASFDQLLAQRGIRFLHRKAVVCMNIKDLDQNTHDPQCTVCDGSGVYYYREQEIYGVFYSNSLERMFEHHGVWDIGSAIITFPTEYADGTEADFCPFDQLVIPDFTVRMWELKEFVPTTGLIQQVRYPIQKVDFMASAENNVVKVYNVGVDFNLTIDGKIQWVSGKQPTYNKVLERGDVYIVSYFANPVYTVMQHMRELRISQEMVNGQKVARRMPQQVLTRRDYLRNSPEQEDK